MIVIGLSCMFYYWCCPMVLSMSASVRDSRCRVLQYVHDLPMVGCESDRRLNPSRWVMAYGSKEDLILNAMVGFHDLNDL